MIDIEIFDAKHPNRLLTSIENLESENDVSALRKKISALLDIPISQIALRLDAKGKNIRDEQQISELNLPKKGAQMFLKNLGRQIGWKTVFILEYLGPLLIYPMFYFRPSSLYGSYGQDELKKPVSFAANCALVCFTVHYMKRLMETMLVHRFSNATMPFFNVFKNCGYYWTFAAFISYFINHPYYSSASFGIAQILVGLGGFIISEFGNLSIHLLLRDLRPPGSKVRKIPMPNANPMTQLFNFVSCPNYTYEVCSWIFFSIMTQSLPAMIFTAAGFIQMAVWAIGKHRNYRREFSNYPRSRRAIVPFVI